MFDIGDSYGHCSFSLHFFYISKKKSFDDKKKKRIHRHLKGCLFYSSFCLEKKKRYLVHLSFVYLSLILSMNQVERLCFGVPRSPWIVSANEMNAEPVPNAFLIWKWSSREKNKMLLSLPLSFLALPPGPGGGGRGRPKRRFS